MSKNTTSRSNSEGDCQVFIPFVPEEENQTKAILIVKLEGQDTLYHLLYSTRYSEYGFDTVSDRWNAKDVFHAFSVFDNEIFHNTKIEVSNSRLLGTAVDTIVNDPVTLIIDSVSNQFQGRSQVLYRMTIWISYYVCGTCYARTNNNPISKTLSEGCCNTTYYSGAVTFWIDDGQSDWGWYDPSGGGGGGGGIICPGCNWEDTNPCEEQDPNQPQEPCDQDWQPVLNAVPEPFDVNSYDDTVRISSALENTYPCAFAFLNDSLPNINWLAQIAGGNVFEDSAYMHLSFDTSTVYTQPGQRQAHTRSDTLVRLINGQTHFRATIAFKWLVFKKRNEGIYGFNHSS